MSEDQSTTARQHITPVKPELDMVKEVADAMQRAGFSEAHVTYFLNLKRAQQARGLDPLTQLMYLTLAINDLFIGAPAVPPQVRISLNYSKHPASWLQDIQAGVLPFLKLNEGFFFKV